MIKAILLFTICFAGYLYASSNDSVRYTLEWGADAEHTFYVQMEFKPSNGKHSDVKIPAWRPGRYILQNYAAAISHFQAKDVHGNSLDWHKTDKDTWTIVNPRKGEIAVSYRFYANTTDAGSSSVGKDLYYFNGVNLFMYLPGKEEMPATLLIPALMDENLKVATALPTLKNDRRRFFASSYHQLVDCPVIISSKIHTLKFEINNTRFFLHFQGNYRGNEKTDTWLTSALAILFKEQAAIFKGYPFTEYHCLYLLNNRRQRHAVEHATSSCYSLPEEVTSSIDAMKYGVLGITSHEFWHVWNVKKFRPLAMTPYRYDQEAYTSQHWFTEGVTSYMEELTLLRAGLRSEDEFLRHLANTFQSLDNSYATRIVSPAQASFDTWLSGNKLANPFHRTSFYPLGERCGFLLDMHLRIETKGNKSIEDLFQYLDENYSHPSKGIPEDGIQKACEKLIGKSCKIFFQDYIFGTTPIHYDLYLSTVGLTLNTFVDTTESWPKLGIQTAKEASGTLLRVMVKPESDAMRAGLGDDDIIATINNIPVMDVPDEFFTSIKTGDSISIGRIHNFNIEQLTIIYSGKDAPLIYDIIPNPDALPLQQNHKIEWLKSRSSHEIK